jgi:hypothetical protein
MNGIALLVETSLQVIEHFQVDLGVAWPLLTVRRDPIAKPLGDL